MALTVTLNNRTVFGNKKVTIADVDFDSSYASGGESLTAADLGMKQVQLLLASGKSGLIFEYDYDNSKLKAMAPTGGTAPTTLAAPSVAVTVPSGATAVTSTAPQPDLSETLTGGQAIEVGDTTNLSSVTDVRVMAVGV